MNLPPISEEEKRLMKSIFCFQQILALHNIQNKIEQTQGTLLQDLIFLRNQYNQDGIIEITEKDQLIENSLKNQQIFHKFKNQQFVQMIEGKLQFNILGTYEDIISLQTNDFINFQNQLNDEFYLIKENKLPSFNVQDQILQNVKKIQQIINQRIQEFYHILYKSINWSDEFIQQEQFPCHLMSSQQASIIILNNFRQFFKSYDSFKQIDFDQEYSINQINRLLSIIIYCQNSLQEYKLMALIQNFIYYSIDLIADQNIIFIKKIITSQLCFDLRDLNQIQYASDNIIDKIQRIKNQAAFSNFSYEINDKQFLEQTFIEDAEQDKLRKKYNDNLILKRQYLGSITNFQNSRFGQVLLKTQIHKKILQIFNTFQYKLAMKQFYKLNNIPEEFEPSRPIQNTYIILMEDANFQGMTLMNGYIIINIKYILELRKLNQNSRRKGEWRELLITFICHTWFHEFSHYILRENKKSWDIQTPNFKENILQNNRIFQIFDEKEFIKFESGDFFEKLLFGKIFTPKDFTFEYSKYFLNILNWNLQDREVFIQQIAQASSKMEENIIQYEGEDSQRS